jgi:hypothetical protein
MAPRYTPNLHAKELSKELQTNLEKLAHKQCNIGVMKTFAQHLNAYIADTPLPALKQAAEQRMVFLPAQRVSNNTHPLAHPNV